MILLLSRQDLKPYAREYSIFDLSLSDIDGLTERIIGIADFIAIMNERGQVNIFQNRYGRSGLLPVREATDEVNMAIRRIVDSPVNSEPSIMQAVRPVQEVRDEEEI